MSSTKNTAFLGPRYGLTLRYNLSELYWKSASHPRVFETWNPFRESAEVTHKLPPACVDHSCIGWLSDYWQPEALLVFTGSLGLLFPNEISNLSRGR